MYGVERKPASFSAKVKVKMAIPSTVLASEPSLGLPMKVRAVATSRVPTEV